MTWNYVNKGKGQFSSRLEHRQVMEKHLGRKLLRTEYVHHKDGNKKNNAVENLEIVTDHKEHYKKDYAIGRHRIPLSGQGQSWEDVPKRRIYTNGRKKSIISLIYAQN